jgi:hypothetical protein
MRKFRAILLVVVGLAFAACWADSPAGSDTRPDVKDADAQRIIHVMDGADAKAYADYLRAVQKIHHDAFARLNTREGELTRLGKLDDAVSIRDFIDFVRKQDADNAALADGTKLFMPVNEVVGTWVEHDGVGPFYQMMPNGHFVFNNNEPGTWSLTADSLTLTWDTKSGQHNVGRVDTYIQIDGKHISGNSSQGHPVGIDRVAQNGNAR